MFSEIFVFKDLMWLGGALYPVGYDMKIGMVVVILKRFFGGWM
jgi:hypothetical protein